MEKFSFLVVIKTLLIIMLATLVGCGGGGSDEESPNQSTALQGVFLDNKVSGLFYRSGSLSGFTDSNGTYRYEPGATITFEIGGIVIGTANATAIMTPISLVPDAVDETHPTVVNIVRFLITLDSDNKLDNGIQINADVHVIAKELSLDFSLAGQAFDNASNVQNVIALVTKGVNSFATQQVAIDHFNGTLMGLLAGIYNGTYSGDDRGTWSIVVNPNGTITGSGCSTVEQSAFGISGTVTSDGELSSFGFAADGKFLGRFDLSSGQFSGDWVAGGDGGLYAGSKASARSGGVCANNLPMNIAPVANAGVNQSVLTSSTVSLTGEASTDANNDALTYRWIMVSKPVESESSLFDANTLNASFIPDIEGNYVVRLIVNDGNENSSPDSVSITASTGKINTRPIAKAGNDRTVPTGVAVTLDGSQSSDADGDALTYQWSPAISRREGNAGMSIIDSTSVNASFTPSTDGDYLIQLVVNDGKGDSLANTVTITAVTELVNTPPVANAGLNKTVLLNSLTSLDASKSSDEQGDALTYSWSLISQPEGSDIGISNPLAKKASFTPDTLGEYVFQLAVSDGVNTDVVDSITITTAIKVGFNEDGLAIYNTVMSDFVSYASSDISIVAPQLAENGAVVPITISFPSQVSRLWLFVVPNDAPIALKADFLVANDNGLLSTRIKMKKTGDVIAVLIDSAGDIIATQLNVEVTIGSTPAPVDCTVLDCAPALKSFKVKASSGNVKMLVSSSMSLEDYIENIQLQVDGLPVLTVSTTPNLSKNPYFSFNFTSPAAGTSSELIVTGSASGMRSASSTIIVTAP